MTNFHNILRNLCLLVVACLPLIADAQTHKAPAPMFRDPVTDGAADPVVFWNRAEKCWWMLYTQRRANLNTADVAYCYGNKIGVAQSDDNGASWYYRGTLDLDFEPGHNTFWAPEVVYHKGTYHLFVTYIRGVRNHWGGHPQFIHYTSKNLWDWKYKGSVDFNPGERSIDVTIFPKPDGGWRAWYKNENAGSQTYCSDSKNLKTWSKGHQAIKGPGCEGPKVFQFKGYYWMLTDEWRGLRLYRSNDLDTWESQGLILGEPGTRPDDATNGLHCDVVVLGEKAYVIYFTHPERIKGVEAEEPAAGVMPYKHRRTSIQCAELLFDNGTLRCDRSDKFDFFLPEL